MPKANDKLVTFKDLKQAIRLATHGLVKQLIPQLKKVLMTKEDYIKYQETTLAKLENLEKRIIELKYEIRMNRKLYAFWAERHLSPSLKEEFLKFQESLQKKKVKRVD